MYNVIAENEYRYIVDEDTGEPMAINLLTGEVVETVQRTMPRGTISYTPESQRKYAERKAKDQKKFLVRKANDSLGYFVFVSVVEDFMELTPATATRLIYLNTFTRWVNNQLWVTERTPMKQTDLTKVLNLSKSTVSRFLNEVSPKYITIDNNGLLFTNSDIFYRGELKTSIYAQRQKIYIEGVRKLYEGVDAKNHKQIGFLFKMLPYVNFEYNLLCYNPDETDLEKIETMSIKEFCNVIGYDLKHLNNLVDIYKSVHFDVKGRAERFCALIYDGTSRHNAKICINPHILYRGSDYTKVEVLGAFCKA